MKGNDSINLLMGVTLSEMGGAQKVVYDLISTLPRDEYCITLVTYPRGELIEWIEDLKYHKGIEVKIIGIPEIRRELSPFYDVVTFLKLYKLMKVNRYDIAHFHSSKMGILGRLAASVARVQKIYFTVHGWGINEYQPRWLQKMFGFSEKVAGKLCTKCLCVSEYHRNMGIKMGWIRPEKSCVIYNGIDKAPTLKGKLRRELHLEDDIPIIGTVMRLREPKQPIYTIEVFYEVLKSGYRAKLVIIGDGPMYDDCKSVIHRLKLQNDVYMLGTRKDARELINDMDIVTMFSKWEGLPIAIIEAMFAQKPVVSSSVGGIPEIIDEGTSGFMIDGLDINEGAERILYLLKDKNLRMNIGRAAQQKAIECFSKERMVRNYVKIYRED